MAEAANILSITAAPSAVASSPLLHLPPELRLKVYQHYLSSIEVSIHQPTTPTERSHQQGPDHAHSTQCSKQRRPSQYLNLLLAHSTFNQEANPLVAKFVNFYIRCVSCWNPFVPQPDLSMLPQMNHVTVHCERSDVIDGPNSKPGNRSHMVKNVAKALREQCIKTGQLQRLTCSNFWYLCGSSICFSTYDDRYRCLVEVYVTEVIKDMLVVTKTVELNIEWIRIKISAKLGSEGKCVTIAIVKPHAWEQALGKKVKTFLLRTKLFDEVHVSDRYFIRREKR